jgi:phosphohistidine phosphatase SixA
VNAQGGPKHAPGCRRRGGNSSDAHTSSGAELLVVRHARAGDRSAWLGDDRLRPLDKRGRKQARALVEALEPFAVERILSSPYLRCVETVEPLARSRGIEITLCDELGEGRVEGIALALSAAGEPVVLCVHAGLSDAAFGERLKKAETLVVDAAGRVARRFRV